jgi:stalled ribosome alternative rescue factor ArfA
MDLQGQKKMGKGSYKQNSKELEEKINEMYLYMLKKFVT